MSCKKCKKVQEENLKGKNIAYIRIGSANVTVGACDGHFNMLQRQLGVVPSRVFRIKDLGLPPSKPKNIKTSIPHKLTNC
jgi:hypothetical protein